MGYRLPILLIDHAPWVERCAGPYSAAIPFQPDSIRWQQIAIYHAPSDILYNDSK